MVNFTLACLSLAVLLFLVVYYKWGLLHAVVFFLAASWLIPKGRNVVKNKPKYPENLGNEPHIAIIIADNFSIFSYLFRGLPLYADGVDILVNSFQNNKPYKIYNKLTKSQFIDVVNNINAKSLIIFGHGKRHSLSLNSKDSIHYCELRGAPMKDYIAQLHCNGEGGESLNEIIGCPGFVVDGLRYAFQNRKDCKFILSKLP